MAIEPIAALIVLAAAAATPWLPPAAAADEAPPPTTVMRDPGGEGFVIPRFGLWFGGDVTVTGGAPEDDPAFLELDDLSLLARWEPVPRLAFFLETRLENTVELVEGVGVEKEGADITIERLYAEGLLTPHLTLRVGKIFTPFGLWNVIRRAPLAWTVEEPAVAEQMFPHRATGLNLAYQTTWRGWTLDATAYGPAQDELPLRQTTEDGLMGGGRTAVGRALGPVYAAVGLNGVGFEEHETGRWADTWSADLELTARGHLVSGELSYEHLRGPGVSRQAGFYLQDAFPIAPSLAPNLYAVLRVEHFQPRSGPSGTGGLIGLHWRPLRHLIVKAGYQFGDRLDVEDDEILLPGFLASVSLFF